jgi:hypothetical protein
MMMIVEQAYGCHGGQVWKLEPTKSTYVGVIGLLKEKRLIWSQELKWTARSSFVEVSRSV